MPGSDVEPSGWTFSTSLSGPTPSKANPPDDPSILNLTWTYSGPALSGTGIGPFQVTIEGTAPSPAPLRNGYFAALGTLVVGPNAGSQVANVGQLPIPQVVPEPSAVGLLLLSGAAFLADRLRKR